MKFLIVTNKRILVDKHLFLKQTFYKIWKSF